MPHRIELAHAALKDLPRLAPATLSRVRLAIDGLAENPRPVGCRKLQPGNVMRIRVGDYRVLYAIDDQHQVVRVLRIRHRRDAYRDL